MKTAIFSKKLDQNLTFSRPGYAYIYVDINGQPGTSGRQICSTGLMGSTIMYSGDDEKCFRQICRKWLKKYESMVVFW